MHSATPILEKENLQALAQSASREVVLSILEAFWQSNDTLYTALEAHISASDLEEAAKSAHGLKGSSANLGASGICETATQLEIACKEGRADEARALLERLPSLFAQTKSEITVLAETF